MVTGDATVDIEKGFSVGADDCIMKPLDINYLAARIRKMVRRKDRILLVEDDRQVCDIITRVLGKHGCEVEVLNDGSNFVAKVKQFVPDIILLDISLGVPPDGVELCGLVKNDPEMKSIPVLMLTANECTRSIDACFSMGVEDYIFKPFTIPDLLGKIKKHLARNRSSQ
jgi:DNA-binding response OmpR family regulator